MATVDHLYSRYHLKRWVKRKPGEVRRVLACYECNQRRVIEETSSLSKAEIQRRANGFSLNPKGKPLITGTLSSLNEVIAILKQAGILFSHEH